MTDTWDTRFEDLLRQAVPSLLPGAIDPTEDLRNAGPDSTGSVELLRVLRVPKIHPCRSQE